MRRTSHDYYGGASSAAWAEHWRQQRQERANRPVERREEPDKLELRAAPLNRTARLAAAAWEHVRSGAIMAVKREGDKPPFEPGQVLASISVVDDRKERERLAGPEPSEAEILGRRTRTVGTSQLSPVLCASIRHEVAQEHERAGITPPEGYRQLDVPTIINITADLRQRRQAVHMGESRVLLYRANGTFVCAEDALSLLLPEQRATVTSDTTVSVACAGLPRNPYQDADPLMYATNEAKALADWYVAPDGLHTWLEGAPRPVARPEPAAKSYPLDERVIEAMYDSVRAIEGDWRARDIPRRDWPAYFVERTTQALVTGMHPFEQARWTFWQSSTEDAWSFRERLRRELRDTVTGVAL